MDFSSQGQRDTSRCRLGTIARRRDRQRMQPTPTMSHTHAHTRAHTHTSARARARQQTERALPAKHRIKAVMKIPLNWKCREKAKQRFVRVRAPSCDAGTQDAPQRERRRPRSRKPNPARDHHPDAARIAHQSPAARSNTGQPPRANTQRTSTTTLPK